MERSEPDLRNESLTFRAHRSRSHGQRPTRLPRGGRLNAGESEVPEEANPTPSLDSVLGGELSAPDRVVAALARCHWTELESVGMPRVAVVLCRCRRPRRARERDRRRGEHGHRVGDLSGGPGRSAGGHLRTDHEPAPAPAPPAVSRRRRVLVAGPLASGAGLDDGAAGRAGPLRGAGRQVHRRRPHCRCPPDLTGPHRVVLRVPTSRTGSEVIGWVARDTLGNQSSGSTSAVGIRT